jgi:tRNA splicing endonuclease
MDIDGEVTNVNLKIYHNKSQKGEVAITLENNVIGKVAAQFLVDEDKITGMVACENDSTKNQLEGFGDLLSEAFEDKKVNISLVQSNYIELEKFGDDRDKDSKAVSTKELYKTAKIFLKSINNIGGEKYEN